MIGSKCQIFYEKDPFVVSSGKMQYLYDEEGHRYIDCISNVQHVGHCHPVVVESITNQLMSSTCNVRFVSSKLTECADQLLKTLPGLDTVLFCNSGSEANDLALRLARDFTQNHDMIVLDHAYHGHVTTTMQMSPYKFDHGCSIQKPDWVHVAPVPDVFRGMHRLDDQHLNDEEKLHEAGQKYANEVLQLLKKAEQQAEVWLATLLRLSNPVEVKSSHLKHTSNWIRQDRAVLLGASTPQRWICARHCHNGQTDGQWIPVAAVVTRKEIADKLGGNPVACAAVLGVLKVIKDEKLVEHSHKMGGVFEKELYGLMKRHECIGMSEVREPDSELAHSLIMNLRQNYGVLLNADGPHTNILKFKPPLCFNEQDLREVVDALDKALTQMSC
uniref:Uncharacterized protein n=1 Tax=Ditylenchus dipsaci TaxID=166011 RepID=A0A915E5Q1_9BILA